FDVVQIEHQHIAARTQNFGIRRTPKVFDDRNLVALPREHRRKLRFESREAIEQRRGSPHISPSIAPCARSKNFRMMRQRKTEYIHFVFLLQIFKQRCRSQSSSTCSCFWSFRREKKCAGLRHTPLWFFPRFDATRILAPERSLFREDDPCSRHFAARPLMRLC